jgi:ribonuclease HII
MPSLDMERAAGGRVAGVDEAGRGPLAGPVVAAAVVLPADLPAELAAMLDDSKKLTAAQRMAAFLALRASAAEIGVGAASVTEILRLNILHASMLAMRRAVVRLGAVPDLALVDGNYPPKLACAVRCVVGGDALCLSISAASIVAKVIRDRAMVRVAGQCGLCDGGAPRGLGTTRTDPSSSGVVRFRCTTSPRIDDSALT